MTLDFHIYAIKSDIKMRRGNYKKKTIQLILLPIQKQRKEKKEKN